MDNIDKGFLRRSGTSRNRLAELMTLHRMSIADMTTETTEDAAIIEVMKCPHCRTYINPPSVCCENGHFMCKQCQIFHPMCPICGTNGFPNKCNTVFDHILKDMYFPCINIDHGCLAFIKCADLKNHLKECSFERVRCRFESAGCKEVVTRHNQKMHDEICPFGFSCKVNVQAHGKNLIDCHWRGLREDIYEHVTKNHSTNSWLPPVLQTNVTFTWMLPMDIDISKTEFLYLDDVKEMFYFHVKNEKYGSQHIAMQHIGKDEVGSKFMYAVEFKLGQKQIVFRDLVVPYSEKDIFKHSSCCVFDYRFLVHHFQAERICDCYVRIFRVGHEDKRGKRHLEFLRSKVSEESDGTISNRESFKDRIECCLESIEIHDSHA